jgi:hypothetical protein
MNQAGAQSAPAPYGVIYLPAVLDGTADQRDLCLPLCVAYLISMEMRFYLPFRRDLVHKVDWAFDQVMNGQPLASKGIVYVPVSNAAECSELLSRCTLVLAGGAAAEITGLAIPQAAIVANGTGVSMELRNADALDETVRARLAACAELINVQGNGITTEGHFSLSW